MSFTEEFLQKFARATRGNPGLIQALANEVLRSVDYKASAPSLLEGLLLELLRTAEALGVEDLNVYKLKYYDEEAQGLLALISAIGPCSKEVLERLWQAGSGHPQPLRSLLGRALDDALIQVEGEHDEAFSLIHENLRHALRAKAFAPQSGVSRLLRQIEREAQPLLATFDKIRLAEFLEKTASCARFILQYFQEEQATPKRLLVVPFLDRLRQELETNLNLQVVDFDTRLRLDHVALELAILERAFEKGEEIAKKLLRAISDRNDPVANEMRAKTQFHLGNIYRIWKREWAEAIELLREAIESEVLNDADHYYALGSLAICEILLAAQDEKAIQESFGYLDEARKVLRTKDPLRYAFLTEFLGGYYYRENDYVKALPFFEHASRIYAQHDEVTRWLMTQRHIAKMNFLLGHFAKSLDLFLELLPVAERLSLDQECIEILIYVVRNRYKMGDLKKLIPSCLYLTSLCERLKDFRPLASIIEPATHAYLEVGQVKNALHLVQSRMQNIGAGTQGALQEVICELLLVQIYQAMGRIDEAKTKSREVNDKIKKLMGEHHQAEDARQVHLFYEIELLRREKGPRQALLAIDQAIGKGDFTGFTLTEAHLKAFQFAVWAEEGDFVERFMPRCLQALDKVSVRERMAFFVDLGKFHLDQNDLKKAEKALRSAGSLLSRVTHHVTRAQLFDQKARLALRHGKRDAAVKNLTYAAQEFGKNLQTWQSEDRRRFEQNSPEFQEHQVVSLMLDERAC